MTTRTRKQKTQRQKEIEYLDDLFSGFIRKRAMLKVHGCERCFTQKVSWKQLQCSHFWGRMRKSVRWDADNAAGLCGACHIYLTSHPEEHRQFFLERLGQDKYNELMLRANCVHRVDLGAVALHLEAMLDSEEK